MRVRYYFGCNKEETDHFATQLANGIFGLSSFEFYLNHLYEMKKIDRRVFSLCLGEDGILIGYIKVDT